MSYTFDIEKYNKTFCKGDDLRKHANAESIKIFPFVSRQDVEINMEKIAGGYISRLREEKPVGIDVEELVDAIKKDTEIENGKEQLFHDLIKQLYFDGDSNMLPLNLKMIQQRLCKERLEQKTAEYMASVLGNKQSICESLNKAFDLLESQSHVLDRVVMSKLETSKDINSEDSWFYKVVNVYDECFTADFDYIISETKRTREYLTMLLDYYLFAYTAQTCLQLNRLTNGCRDNITPLYFSLDWEKTSHGRKCFSIGWQMLSASIETVFAHVVTLEMLNQIEEDNVYDYIALKEMANNPLVEHDIAEQIRLISKRYRTIVTDSPDMSALEAPDNLPENIDNEIKFLFNCVKTQFLDSNTGRIAPYRRYSEKIVDVCKKYLKSRGRSGWMLNVSDSLLIFLTKICIKDQERMRLNDVFRELEKRGVFFDDLSKTCVAEFYEKLNLIEKKSDSGDAKYVKRIL